MATKHDLPAWVLDAVRAAGGSASILQVARHIWSEHQTDLEASGDLFYTWQYDMRWAAQRLRDSGRLAGKQGKRGGTWDLPTPSK